MDVSTDLLQIYAFDDRYSVPHWRTVEARSAQSDDLARQILEANQNYRRVEIWLEDRRLADVKRAA
jgi:hypothetical protein